MEKSIIYLINENYILFFTFIKIYFPLICKMTDSTFFDNLPFVIWVKIGKMLDKKSLLKLGMTNKYAINLTKIIMLIKLRGSVWFHLLGAFEPFGIKNTACFQTYMVYMLDNLLDEEILKTGIDSFPNYNTLNCTSDVITPSDKVLTIYNSPDETEESLNQYKKTIDNMYRLIVYYHIQDFYPYLLFYHRAIKRNLCFI